ncbi:MAG: hypothetical protein GY799_29415 [Desulfobulbaceae bacterium]|nr:hypothetical protein [Desulfobulbaceae bacterium]
MKLWKEFRDYRNHGRHRDSSQGSDLFGKFVHSIHWKEIPALRQPHVKDSDPSEGWCKRYQRLSDGCKIEIKCTSTRSGKQRFFSFYLLED